MTVTTNLGLVLVESTDTLAGGDPNGALQAKVNTAWNRIDQVTGAIICTSITRPSTTYPQMTIFETDTRLMQVRNAANNAWLMVNTGIPVVANTGAIGSPYTNQIIYDTSVNSLRKYEGSGVWSMFDANATTKFRSTNLSLSSNTTFQNITGFSWTVSEGAYELRGYIPYLGAGDTGVYGAAGGLKLAFTGPAGASLLFTNFGPNQGDLTSYNTVVEGLAGTGRFMGSNGGTIMSCQPQGTLVVGVTGGTFQAQYAQAGSSATATQILGGSRMSLTKIV
jgi:hypothetical protein